MSYALLRAGPVQMAPVERVQDEHVGQPCHGAPMRRSCVSPSPNEEASVHMQKVVAGASDEQLEAVQTDALKRAEVTGGRWSALTH